MLKAFGAFLGIIVLLAFLGAGGLGLVLGLIGTVFGIIAGLIGAVVGLAAGLVGVVISVLGGLAGLLLPLVAVVLILVGLASLAFS